jgi:hypothetical protein
MSLLIGILVPVLLLVRNRMPGISSNFRHICAIVAPGRNAFGGFLVGFGSRWAGGCASGHAITGLADLQPASLIAVVGFFAGGLFMTFVVLPVILSCRACTTFRPRRR